MASETQNVYISNHRFLYWFFVFKINLLLLLIQYMYIRFCTEYGDIHVVLKEEEEKENQIYGNKAEKQAKNFARTKSVHVRNETVSVTKRCEDSLNWDPYLDTFLKKIKDRFLYETLYVNSINIYKMIIYFFLQIFNSRRYKFHNLIVCFFIFFLTT